MPTQKIRSSKRAAGAIAAIMSIATAIGGVWYVRQPGGDAVPAAVALASDTLIRPWEGTELRAYYDRVARPPVWTICSGDTRNVRPGMVETPAGCSKRLKTRLATEFYPGLKACVDGFEAKPVAWQAMMISLAWNVGVGGACGSSAARLGRASQYQASCIAATAFNKAGGRMIIGLVKRREMGDATRIGEAELCVSGL
ncbi:glycoside hydrolase [Labrys sp. WJW]|uniref:lysozyme n=1 Tax=Labrys sp. WJW TaxID=1737983 RepID=UPI00082C9365|nr:lysozyme [Labrys sp. WJW]OCC05281.1 glycoside hydrolase [Labrys sp. WJW]